MTYPRVDRFNFSAWICNLRASPEVSFSPQLSLLVPLQMTFLGNKRVSLEGRYYLPSQTQHGVFVSGRYGFTSGLIGMGVGVSQRSLQLFPPSIEGISASVSIGVSVLPGDLRNMSPFINVTFG